MFRIIYTLLFTILFFACSQPQGPANVLILYSDDQSYNTINALGNDEIRTPQLDKLASEGIAFTRAHIMGGRSGALCVPSRAMLHTGRYVNNLQGNGGIIPEDHITLPEVLSTNGYRTFMTGKWHNNKESLSRIYQSGENIYLGGMHWPRDGGHFKPLLHHFDSTGVFPVENRWQHEEFSSTAYSNAVIDFIKSSQNNDHPFMAYVAFTSPHDPRTPPTGYEYDTSAISLPANYLPEHPFNNGEMKVRDEQLLPWPRTPEAIKMEVANYYGMITEMDEQIGRILQTLEETGQRDNTIIVFAGDNGLAVGSHGLLGKQNLYEHSIRVPMIISAPGLSGGKAVESFSYIPDIFPTVLDLLDIPIPAEVDGQSLVNTMKYDSSVRNNAYYIYRDLQRGVRTDDNWKLIKYLVRGETTTQLFDLNNDPNEMSNLSADPDYSDKLAEMEELLANEMRSYGDDLDPSLPYFGKKMPLIRKMDRPNKGKGAKVTYNTSYSSRYPAEGDRSLVDEKLGTEDDFSMDWQAFHENDMEVILQWEELQSIQDFSVSFLSNQGSYIFLPTEVIIEGSSDGKNYFKILEKAVESKPQNQVYIEEFKTKVYPKEVRFVKVTAKNVGLCPDWHPGKGDRAWLFVDEIFVH